MPGPRPRRNLPARMPTSPMGSSDPTDGPEYAIGMLIVLGFGLCAVMLFIGIGKAWHDCGHFPIWHGNSPGVSHYTIGSGACGYAGYEDVEYFFHGKHLP